MEINYSKRSTDRKKNLAAIRREGNIPAVLYVAGESHAITLKGEDLRSGLRKVNKGALSTTVFHLQDEKGASIKAIIKDIQYHVTTYDVMHVDLVELRNDAPITVNVPIRLQGSVDCVGVKLGGVLRPVIRTLKVRCLPEFMPTELFIDVSQLAIKQSKRLKDIELSDKVRPLADLNEVAVVVAKR